MLPDLIKKVREVAHFYEAVHRFFAPPEVQSQGMLLISTIG
jgi:Co/Zn/Cd efflux system component